MGRATPTPRPSKVPSLRYSSRTLFRTGEWRAAQSIFLCPSGARAGSLTMDSLCISFLLSSGFLSFGGHRLLDGLYLLAHTEHKAADDDEQEERDQPEPDSQVAGGLLGEAKDQADDGPTAGPDPHQDGARPL